MRGKIRYLSCNKKHFKVQEVYFMLKEIYASHVISILRALSWGSNYWHLLTKRKLESEDIELWIVSKIVLGAQKTDPYPSPQKKEKKSERKSTKSYLNAFYETSIS